MIRIAAAAISTTLLIALLLQPQNTSASSSPPPHTWRETLCIDFEDQPINLDIARRCVDVSGCNDDNIADMAAFTVGAVCTRITQDSNAETVAMASQCCQDLVCFGRMHKYVLKRLRFGAKIVDPETELKKRIRRKKEEEHNEEENKNTCGKTFAQRIDCLANEIRNADAAGSLHLLQVGAHVGALDHDPVFPHVFSDTRIRAVIVEPLPLQFSELTRNYAPAAVENVATHDWKEYSADSASSSHQQPRVQLLNAAVCPSKMSDTLTEFVCSRPPERQIEQSIDEFNSRMFNYLYRAHHSQMGRLSTVMQASDSGTTADDFEGADWRAGSETNQPMTVQVRCVSAEYAAAKLGRVDVLVIDAEGADLIVLESILEWAVTRTATAAAGTGADNGRSYFPALVLFEHSGLSFDQKKNSVGLMDRLGYICELHNMQDVMCVLASSSLALASGAIATAGTGAGNGADGSGYRSASATSSGDATSINGTGASDAGAGTDTDTGTATSTHGAGTDATSDNGAGTADDNGYIGSSSSGGGSGKKVGMKKQKKKKKKTLALSIDAETKEVEFDMEWRADNSALLGCLQHLIRAHQCSRLVEAVQKLHNE